MSAQRRQRPRAAGVDVFACLGVAKTTRYRHARPRPTPTLRFLAAANEAGPSTSDETHFAARARNRDAQLLAIFDMFVRRDDVEACSFINPLLEVGGVHPRQQRMRSERLGVPCGVERGRSLPYQPVPMPGLSRSSAGGWRRQLVRVVADTP